jgi:hypothetical protein
MVRNPIEMAPALHAQIFLSGFESIADFSRAWNLQDERRHGRKLGLLCKYPHPLLYGDNCLLGAQIERLLTTARRHRVLIVLLDDIIAEPRKEYLRILNFLDVPDDGRSNFPIYNAARSIKWPRLRVVLHCGAELRRRLRIPRGSGLLRHLESINLVERPRDPLSIEMMNELREYFRDDVRLLSQIIGKDLGDWLANRHSARTVPVHSFKLGAPAPLTRSFS